MSKAGKVPQIEPTYEQMSLHVDGVGLKIAAVGRGGNRPPAVFLHGFGSTKEDYADIVHHPAFAGRAFLAYDAPGCGQTFCEDTAKIDMTFLVKTAQIVLRRAGIQRFHLIGHSMGGLTALLLAHQEPHRVLSFVNIEGNLAPEDCFLSRQALTHPAADAEAFLNDLTERTRRAPLRAAALYAASLGHKVQPGAVRGILESIVDLSDHGDLMAKFLALRCPDRKSVV